MKFKILYAVVAGLLLAGCNPSDSNSGSNDVTNPSNSGSDSNDNTNTDNNQELAGKVADGYLVGATVCLDLNTNAVCDLGEPSAITADGGEYLLDVTAEQLEQGELLVQVTSETIDEDDMQPVGNPYKLTAPDGHNTFISPITTLVARAMENNLTLDQENALQELALDLGIEDPESLLDDFIAAGSKGNVSAQRLHQMAQVIATTMGATRKDLEAALVVIGNDPQAYARAIEATLAEALTSNLSTVVKAAEGDTEAATLLQESMEATATTGAVELKADQQASEPMESNQIASAFTQGLYQFEEDFFLEIDCENETAVRCLGVTKLGLDDDSSTMTSAFTKYDFDANGIRTEESSSDLDFDYEPNAGINWVVDENGEFKKVEFAGLWFPYSINDDSSISADRAFLSSLPVADPEDPTFSQLEAAPVIDRLKVAQDISLEERDIEGESLIVILRKLIGADEESRLDGLTMQFDTSLTFPPGSTSYWFTFGNVETTPTIKPNDHGGVSIMDDTGNWGSDQVLDSLNDLFTLASNKGLLTWGETLSGDNSYQLKFKSSDSGQSSGMATLTQQDDGTGALVDDSAIDVSWERKTWYGKDAIVLSPFAVRRYGLERIALVDTGSATGESVHWAELESAAGAENTNMLMVNDTAMEALASELKAVLSIEATL